MGGISLSELAVILLIGFLLFGPRRLPDMARRLGRLMGQVQRFSGDIREGFERSAATDVSRETSSLEEARRDLGPTTSDTPPEHADDEESR